MRIPTIRALRRVEIQALFSDCRVVIPIVGCLRPATQ